MSNSVLSNDITWRYISGSTVAHVVAWCLRYQAITWINTDLSQTMISGVQAIKTSILRMGLKSMLTKLKSYLAGTNELIICLILIKSAGSINYIKWCHCAQMQMKLWTVMSYGPQNFSIKYNKKYDKHLYMVIVKSMKLKVKAKCRRR